MKAFDLEKIQQKINTFVSERNWEQFHSPKNLSMALSVECSELLEIFQWMSETQSLNIQNDPPTMQKVRNEIADISTYLFLLSSKLGINLEEAILNKLNENEIKYPVSLSQGNAKKYDEF